MSMYTSYTDINNVIRETLAVNSKTRATAQAVKFFNDANRYTGVFEGTVRSGDVQAKGGSLSGVDLVQCTVYGEAGDKLDLSQVADDMIGLSARLDGDGQRIDRLSSEVGECFRYIGPFGVDQAAERLAISGVFAFIDTDYPQLGQRFRRGMTFRPRSDISVLEFGDVRSDDYIIMQQDRDATSAVTADDVAVLRTHNSGTPGFDHGLTCTGGTARLDLEWVKRELSGWIVEMVHNTIDELFKSEPKPASEPAPASEEPEIASEPEPASEPISEPEFNG